MSTPTIFDLLDRLAFLRGAPSVTIVLVAAFAAVALWDARLTLPALLVHYLVVGLLFVDMLDPRLAVVHVLAGLFITLMMLVTARQVNWGQPPAGPSAEDASQPRRLKLGRFHITDRHLLRLGLAALVLASASWPGLPAGPSAAFLPGVVPDAMAYIRPAIIGLAAMGLVGLATTADPLPAGIGLLLLLSGFSLFYGFLDQSLAMTVALIIVQLTVALVIGYLAQAHFLPTDAAVEALD